MNKCIDCKKSISYYAKRCKKCYFKNKIGYIHSQKTKDKIAKTNKITYKLRNRNLIGKNNPFYGKKHNLNTKKLLSKYAKQRVGIKNPMFGKSQPKGEKSKIWKGGKPNCLDCNKLLGSYKSKRCRSCSHSGKLSAFYVHGNGNERYSLLFSNKLKISIRTRDNFRCQICKIQEQKSNKKLSIHHIDYNKDNLSSTNLITLCNSCHTKTNYNRDYWFAYFTYYMLNI